MLNFIETIYSNNKWGEKIRKSENIRRSSNTDNKKKVKEPKLGVQKKVLKKVLSNVTNVRDQIRYFF